MDSKYDILIFDIFVNQPELAKKVKKLIDSKGARDARGAKNDSKTKKK